MRLEKGVCIKIMGKIFLKSLVRMSFFVPLVCAADLSPSGSGVKTGVVDFQKILQESKDFKNKRAKLELKIKIVEEKFKNQQEQLEKKGKQLSVLQGSLAPDKFQAKQMELNKEYTTFQAQLADQNRKFGAESNATVLDLQRQAQAAIEILAPKYKLSVVFDRQCILWLDKNVVDLTPDVLDVLNNKVSPDDNLKESNKSK
jgi:Skp family chaperone for outer membrane proteins